MAIAKESPLNSMARTGLRQIKFRRFATWAGRINLERKLAIALLIAVVTAGTATFAAMTGRLPRAVDTWVILLLLNLDLVLLLCLGALIARRLVILRAATKRGAAGAKLHARLVALFSLVAVTPTIVVATFAVLFFDFGLQVWFSERVRTAIGESLETAEAYVEEHRRTINADVLAMAQDLNRQGPTLVFNPQRFSQIIATQLALRSLTEAVVFDVSGRILARAGFSLLLDFDPEIPEWAVRQANSGEVAILTPTSDDRVRALVRLDAFTDTYLFVGRLLDPRVLAHLDRTRDAVKLYEELEGRRSGLQITFAMIFIVVALMLLLTAVWVGLAFANYLARPIGRLISATERVRGGDLSARVAEGQDQDAIGPLARAFNRMTGELARQQRELLDANRQLDDRRRFIETVLSGVTAGVIGLDKRGRVELSNRTAGELLSMGAAELEGQDLAALLPEFGELVRLARRRPRRGSEGQITLTRPDGSRRTLIVRVAPELGEDGITGFVVTFDDITELLSAQRKAAWADVARRIAHEIKNPLTPIQLSAERIRRKYKDEIKSDPETFRICTDTIVRHVGDIGRMVDEFSSFARMPAPRMAKADLRELVRQAVFLQKSAHPKIEFVNRLPEHPVSLRCDAEQIGRALTNLLLNAAQAIESRGGAEEAPLREGEAAGRVEVTLVDEPSRREILIADNGPGLPADERHRLTEPYVTTRERGTGLGLAIVKKIMEDHGGDLVLEDRPSGGACVRLAFPLPEEQPGQQEGELEAGQQKAILHGA